MISYKVGVYDILRERDLRNLDREIQMSRAEGSNSFGVGIYSEELCDALGINKPLKPLEDRIKIMQQIRGVDFAFPVYSLDRELIKKQIEKVLEKLPKNNDKNANKKYKLGYVPGTFDLFHAGHLEHLLTASEQCERIIVGIKSDDLVQKHKHKSPILSDVERRDIMRHFDFVSDVYIYYTRDLDIAMDYIESKFNQKADAVFFGSDLENDFKSYENINIVFTERDAETMKQRSTSAYAKRYKNLHLGLPQSQRYSSATKISEKGFEQVEGQETIKMPKGQALDE